MPPAPFPSQLEVSECQPKVAAARWTGEVAGMEEPG
jgi:hypothetical protein